ncbi:hypothetical protein C2G38_897812 [Gigaspora rosea]|uniref:Uncharacterized protein n=1 Tax=Gigaspora rosea TaxID=44941 RepID=A0A397VKV8_9GLOM|nr:hypothetical protein C2G38_897812 [Gigaspora rosea]
MTGDVILLLLNFMGLLNQIPYTLYIYIYYRYNSTILFHTQSSSSHLFFTLPTSSVYSFSSYLVTVSPSCVTQYFLSIPS